MQDILAKQDTGSIGFAVSILDHTQQQLDRAIKEVARLTELKQLLETNPETQRIIELMGMRNF